jgi:rhodanese-related sulfurtransferase
MFRLKIGVLLYFMILMFSFIAVFPVITVKAASYTNVSVHEAYDMINNHTQYPNLIILDVREKYEYDLSHLHNATLIPLGEISDRIDELEPYNETEIVVYCRSGARSASASQNLAGNHNFTKIFNMEGGINAWIDAGYPVIEGNIVLPPIDFSFTPFIIILLGTITVLILYIKKRGFKK